MLLDGADAKLEDGNMEGVSTDLVITAEVMADRCTTLTSTSLSQCDIKTMAARRKRLEIRRFRMMAARGSFVDSPAKRLKVNGTVVCDVKTGLNSPEVEAATVRIANMGETCVTDRTAGGVSAPIRVELNLKAEVAGTKDTVAEGNTEDNSGFNKVMMREVVDITCCCVAGSSDGVSGMKGGVVVKSGTGKWEAAVEKTTIFGAGPKCDEEAERRVGSMEWWRRSKERPPLEQSCLAYGAVSVCGRRREMEDAAVVVPAFLTLPAMADGGRNLNAAGGEEESFSFFGVYDGHGGAQAAEFCKERIHGLLAEEMKLAAEGRGGRREAQWEAAMVASFQRVDAELSGICTRQPACTKKEGETRCCVGPLVPGTVGSTAVVAVVGGGRIVVGNCGDSRAVLCRGGRAIPLSRDHKPCHPDEMARIEAAGGRVISWNGYRVLGVLAMSRAIGDRYLKPYIIPVPEITSTSCSDEDECLILASDGLWDVLSNDVVCDVTQKYLAGARSNRHSNCGESEECPAEAAAALLTKLALAKNSRDNISVVVVDLKAYPR